LIRCRTFTWLVLFGLSFVSDAHAIFAPEGKITLKVIDESGQPLSGINVGTTYSIPSVEYGGIKFISHNGLTDGDGIFSSSGKTMDYISYGADKDGFYKSQDSYQFQDSKNDKWVPWNPTVEVVLRKIENPVPMYKRDTKMDDPPQEKGTVLFYG